MAYNFPVNIYGQLGGQLGIKQVPQVFFAKCMGCGKYDWKFGYYNGHVCCSTCIEAKVLELKEQYAEKEERLTQLQIENTQKYLLVHAYIYYKLGDSLIKDEHWQLTLNGLIELQKAEPGALEKSKWFEVFGDNSNAGIECYLTDEFLEANPEIIKEAEYQLKLNKK